MDENYLYILCMAEGIKMVSMNYDNVTREKKPSRMISYRNRII